MYKIRILSVGKTKESWLDEGVNEYLKRLKPIAQFEFIWTKTEEQLLDLSLKESNIICLDPAGPQFTSEQFSQFLISQLEEYGSRLSFIIGGPDGLSPLLKKYPLISLSPMTFTHQMTRLLLIEQIYRGFEIAKGSRYHK